MKKILGLDLGTNSIGWALIEQDFASKQGKILGMGSRIIPMNQDRLGEFDKGNSVSQTAERTSFRSARRLRERYLLRRERLHRVLNILGFLPQHFAEHIDFEKRLGKFKGEFEPKLAFHNNKFIFQSSFLEMLEDFKQNQPDLLNRLNHKGEPAKIPYDWTIYYLRKKALTQKIAKEELAWILLHFNQKRGYYQLRGEDEAENKNKKIELSGRVGWLRQAQRAIVIHEKMFMCNWVTLLFTSTRNRPFLKTKKAAHASANPLSEAI
ncbi:MAG: type II CRISPR RNA-guided endonuclease Cas9 [Cyclobacteriaceae bacterium]